jgi:hypothetical protein
MTVFVAEYLGIKTEQDKIIIPKILNLKDKPKNIQCPFRFGNCDKVQKGYHPVCAIKNSANILWITCEHRLCCTTKTQVNIGTAERVTNPPLVKHQKNILQQIAKEVYGDNVDFNDIGIKREASVPVKGGSSYHADFIMADTKNSSGINFILEMQGGGETTNTGKISRHLDTWATKNSNNKFLRQPISGAGTLVTNAWRRQQEQFLVKGDVAIKAGGRIVFAVGSLIYEYLYSRLNNPDFRSNKSLGWDLALLGFSEFDNSDSQSLAFKINKEKTLYTTYNFFVKALTNQGEISPNFFKGEYKSIL